MKPAILFSALFISQPSLAQSKKEIYTINFSHKGLVHYQGGVQGLKATSPKYYGTKKINKNSDAFRAYMDFLKNSHVEIISNIENKLQRPLNKTLNYYYTHSGIATYLTPKEANEILSINGVMSVEKDKVYELSSDVGPSFISADQIWDGTAMPGDVPNQGEGAIVGVIDTGLNMDHPSFSETSEDGYDFAAANPLGAGNFLGDCDATFICNNKHIGAWDFADDFPPSGESESDGPEDSNGHGTHTAGTAVGNRITAPPGGFEVVFGGTLDAPSISGVAPHAHLIHYDVCVGSCSGAAISAAINQGIDDGVDVLSFSISGGLNPWSDADRTFLDAQAAGIVVVTAAGNTSSSTPTTFANVNHRGPWLLSVANSTHSRALKNEVTIIEPTPVPSDVIDLYGILGRTNNFISDVTAHLTYSGDIDANNAEGCNAWSDPNAFLGNVALIIRGSCNFSVKIDNAEAAGAIAALVFNNVSDIPFAMGGIDSTNIPSLMIGKSDGEAILSFINSVNSTEVQIYLASQAVYLLIDSIGNQLNAGSLIGPNQNFDVTKPDINAPGTLVFAAYADSANVGDEYAFLTGTSMAAPHVSGAAALMIAAHPDWTPAEIQSAMMMTADPDVNNPAGDLATADEVGSGTVDLSKSALSGLVMNETFSNFLAANPSSLGDPASLNIPSLRENNCNGECSWNRTVTNKLDSTVTWTASVINHNSNDTLVEVTPSAFELAPMDSQMLDITFISCSGMTNELRFHDILLTPNDSSIPSSRLTVAAIPTSLAPLSSCDLIYDDSFDSP
jgi:subtilisin family serine protease